DGTSWSGVSAIDVGHSFTAVSCATATFCVAVDNSGNAAVLNHGTWTVSPIGSTMVTVSCPARGFCVATSGAGGSVVYRDGKWSPVPVLDGSTLLYCLVEGVRGRPLRLKTQIALQNVGLALIGSLFALTLVNDLLRWAGH
ncbi:MAG TPA: hypothetical protein VK786_06070, partial [bacterium]|nr:hypothetical protein [bacterium]